MRSIKINDQYEYLPDSNIVINSSLRSIYPNFETKPIVPIDVILSREWLQNSLNSISKIILEISRDCNMRCRYCVYGGHYFFERKNSNKYMTFDIAKKTLDYFFENIKDRINKILTISFFGGEPLLEMEVIKKVVNYSKKIFKDWKLNYSITTNGTLLTRDIIEYFATNSFSLCISIDGPKKIHDEKRIFINGNGTFDIIWKNLLEIKNVSEKYYRKKVRFNVVLSKDIPIKERINFFTGNPLIKDALTLISFVNPIDTDYYDNYPVNYENYFTEMSEIRDEIASKLLKNEKLKAIEMFFGEALKMRGLNQKVFSSLWGGCIISKPLIDVDGNIHFCEKINENFSFGDVFNGVNFEKLKNTINDYIEINKQFCINCDFRFLCHRCYINFGKDGLFRFDEEFCKKQKNIIWGQLLDHINFMEKLNEVAPSCITKSYKSIYKFHQFVKIDKGPINSVIIDFYSGNIFHVENILLEEFENNPIINESMSHNDGTNEFVNSLIEEKLLIKTEPITWIPKYFKDTDAVEKIEGVSLEKSFELELEDGVDLDVIKKLFDLTYISKLVYYGKSNIEPFFPSLRVIYKVKNFDLCISKSSNIFNFKKADETLYYSNMRQNSCWGKKMAVTFDGKIRPCIYSQIEIGDVNSNTNFEFIINKSIQYWEITKNRVDKCKDCELKYICFDCREIAQRHGKGNLFASNPFCKYNPYQGK